jgi:hypothetical protein
MPSRSGVNGMPRRDASGVMTREALRRRLIIGWGLIICGLVVAAPWLGLCGLVGFSMLSYAGPNIWSYQLWFGLSFGALFLGLTAYSLRRALDQTRRRTRGLIGAMGAILVVGGGLSTVSSVTLAMLPPLHDAFDILWESMRLSAPLALAFAAIFIGRWMVIRPYRGA